jgi:DNA-binding response OmpR family regulator
MEPLERELAEALEERSVPAQVGRVLVVAGDTAWKAIIAAIDPLGYQHAAVATLAEAQQSLEAEQTDAIIVHADLPGAAATALIRQLVQASRSTRIIAVTSAESPAHVVAMLLEAGAADVLTIPLDPERCARRIQFAVEQARTTRRREKQLARLQILCRQLNDARLEASEQLDMVCRDLVGAYQDSAQRVTNAEMTTEFRTLLEQELDLEELLRTTLEYLLTKTGPTNAAVYLPNARNEFALGAYVNYDCPRESVAVLLDHLCHAICPQMSRENELVSFDDADDFAAWIGSDAGILEGSQVVGFSCRRDGECLGVVVLFRNKREPFADNLASILDLLRPILAQQIAQVIHVHHRASGGWPKDAIDDELRHEGDDEGYTGLAA